MLEESLTWIGSDAYQEPVRYTVEEDNQNSNHLVVLPSPDWSEKSTLSKQSQHFFLQIELNTHFLFWAYKYLAQHKLDEHQNISERYHDEERDLPLSITIMGIHIAVK